MEKYVIIPRQKIRKIELYINKNKKTLTQIINETGADYAINGALFNSDWTACNHLRANGIQYATDQWTYYGLAWQNTDDRLYMAHSRDESKYDNYLAFCELIYNGAAKSTLTYPSAAGGARQRTAIGFTKSGDTVLYVDNGSKTPEALRDRLFSLGNMEFAVMLDGGGSTQGYFEGQYITSTRVVHSIILVYLNKEAPVSSDGISASQILALAKGEIGTAETATNKIKYNTEYYGSAVSGAAYSWCCVFVWWLFHTLNADSLYYDGNKTASCTTLYNWAKGKGLNISGNYKPGDIVFFDWDGSGDCDHVGILHNINGDIAVTIEGNWTDQVSLITRPVSDIAKAYRPKYKAESASDEFAAACSKLLSAGWEDIIKAIADRL